MNFEQETVLTHLRRTDDYEFEHLIAELWEQYGWETSVTSGSNDRGVDIIAEKDKPFQQKYFVQVKCWGSNNKVGGPDIRQYSSLRRRNSDVDAVVVVTTSSFSRQAIQEGEDLNVKLVNGSDLYDIVTDAEAESLVSEYTDIDSFSCTHCDSFFQNEGDLGNHLAETHDYVECPQCSDVSRDKDALRTHLCEEHGHHECPHCNDIIRNRQALQRHLCEEHDYDECPQCTDAVEDEADLEYHLRRKHNYSQCSHCNDIFQNRDDLQIHLCEEHGYSECPNCSELFQDKLPLQNHLREKHW